jgi:hypothetical protein
MLYRTGDYEEPCEKLTGRKGGNNYENRSERQEVLNQLINALETLQ